MALTGTVLFLALHLVVLHPSSAARVDDYEESSQLDLDEDHAQSQELEFEEESISTSDSPLFLDMAGTRFKGVVDALKKDDNSIYKRLLTAFSTPGAKIAVIGAGGAGKTETILRAMEDLTLTKASFDLRGWFLEKSGIDKKAYLKGYDAIGPDGFSQVKADQLAALKTDMTEIKESIKGKSADVLFLDEIDLGNGLLNEQELEAMKLLLQWSDEVAPSKSKVIVLHPLVSTQAAVKDLLRSLGYPSPGSPTWVDFSEPYSTAVEASMVSALLSEATGSGEEKAAATESVMNYIGGHPGAYMPFLVNKAGALAELRGQAYAQAAEAIKSGAKAKVGGRLIKINVGIQASVGARAFILDLLNHGAAKSDSSVTSSPEVDGAVACMVVMHRDGAYYIPPVEREALDAYCCEESQSDKGKIVPICGTSDVLAADWVSC